VQGSQLVVSAAGGRTEDLAAVPADVLSFNCVQVSGGAARQGEHHGAGRLRPAHEPGRDGDGVLRVFATSSGPSKAHQRTCAASRPTTTLSNQPS
jgi:hypothetical protein